MTSDRKTLSVTLPPQVQDTITSDTIIPQRFQYRRDALISVLWSKGFRFGFRIEEIDQAIQEVNGNARSVAEEIEFIAAIAREPVKPVPPKIHEHTEITQKSRAPIST